MALPLLAANGLSAQREYEFVAQLGNEFDIKQLSVYRLLRDDGVELLAHRSFPGDYTVHRFLVDPRGTWIYLAYFDSTAKLLRILPDWHFEVVQSLDDPQWVYGSTGVALRPDGRMVVVPQVLWADVNGPHYSQPYVVNSEGLTATRCSFERVPESSWTAENTLSQRGRFTLFGQFDNVYRIYHLDPDGEISVVSPEVAWTSRGPNSIYFSQLLDVSRDGRVIVSSGGGNNILAVSHWVDDDGTVTEVDRIRWKDLQPNPGKSGFGGRSMIISPQRNFVVFNGTVTDVWTLNPDGSFGGRRWIPDIASSEFIYSGNGRATLSGDGRVLLVSHGGVFPVGPGGTWVSAHALSVYRLDANGDPLSRTTLIVGPPITAAFITRRVPGDTNGDGWIDVADLVTLVNHVRLGTEIPNPVDLDNADVNRDGECDKRDVQALIGMLLDPGSG